MANLKDLLVNGPSRFIGDIIANKARLTSLEIPTTSNGSTYGLGSSGQILKTNGSSVYWADNTATTLTSILPVTLGGTNSSTPLTANRLMRSNSNGDAIVCSSNIYSDGNKLGVNTSSVTSGYYFEVNGTSLFKDNLFVGTDEQTNTNTKNIFVKNVNGAIALTAGASGARGLYDTTNNRWMLYYSPGVSNDSSGIVRIPTWANKGSSFTPIYFNSNGEPTAITSPLPVTLGGTGKSSFTGNRLIFSSQSSVINNAAKIYVKNETNADAYMAINDTSIVSGYNFQVTGNSNFKGGARFWGTIELGVAAETAGQVIRVGRSSNWYNGRDKAIISMTSNTTGYNPFMSIRADGNGTDSIITGTWDIGVNKQNSNYQNELIFSYITDTVYDNETNTAPSNQIRFKQNGIVKASEFEGNLTGNAATATNVDWSGITNKPITFTPPIASSNILGGIKEGNGIDIDSSGVASVNLSELGLSSAMHFKGITTTAMSDGLTTAAVTINNTSYTPSSGDVVLYSDSEFVWTGSSWESLGRDSSFKVTQTAVADVAVTDEEATAFISSITQDSNGVISATKKKLPNVVTYTQNNNVSVPGAGVGATITKTVYKYNQTTIFTPNGLIIGGTAQNAGLATRGICGISIPNNNTGAATKDHLYINYDGNNTYRSDRQLILQADSVGTYYGNNVYQYAAVRGDAMKAWVEAKGYSTTDEKVKQNIETSNANYPILFSYSTSPTSGTNEYVKYTDKITINPYNGCISPSTSSLYDLGTNSYWWGNVYGEYFSGNAETATTAGGITSAGTTAQFWRGDNTWSNILKQNDENLWTSEDAANLRLGTTLKTLHIATENNINSGAGVHQGKSAGITFGDQSNAYAGIYYQSANNYGSRLYFATTNSFNNGAYARMMITHDGKVGIGTTNPSSLLHVNGNVYTNHIYPNNFNNNNYSNYNLGDSGARWNKIYVKEFEPDILLQSINITLSNSWSNIQSGGTDITLPYDGTYIIQIYDNTTSIHQYVYWSGMFSWYTGDISGITNSNGYEYSEILLHGAGRAINSKNIYLRTYSSNGSKMKLQIKGNNNLTSSSSNIISIKIKYIM